MGRPVKSDMKRERAFEILDYEGEDYQIIKLASRLGVNRRTVQGWKREWLKERHKNNP